MRAFYMSAFVWLLSATQPVWAERTEAETAYMDLIYGYCFQTVAGDAVTQNLLDPYSWDIVENFVVSEAEMQGAEGKVDLRFKLVDDAELMVDLKNNQVCWTQITGIDVANLAARIRLSVIDRDAGGFVADDRVETATSGQISRVTMLGLSAWDETDIPLIILREMLDPPSSRLTTQVLLGTKGPSAEQP